MPSRQRDNSRAGSMFEQAPDPHEVDSQIYGSITDPKILALADERKTIRAIPLQQIAPDPAQPRRIVPSKVLKAAQGKSVTEMIQMWLDMAEQESGRPFNLAGYLGALPDFERPADPTPIEARLIDVVSLAARIAEEGLENQLGIYRTAQGYAINQGEKRWLAHHILHFYTGDEKYTRVKAEVIDAPSVWRQASENGARSNLNAVGMARQLARLVMDIYQRAGVQFRPFEEYAGQCDRHYYAQVADGEQFRIPRGWGEPIMAAMGIKDPSQLRQYRAILKAHDELWTRADDENWAEGAIRAAMKTKRSTVTTVTVSKPVRLKASPEAWARVRALHPDAEDQVLLENIIAFYLDRNRKG